MNVANDFRLKWAGGRSKVALIGGGAIASAVDAYAVEHRTFDVVAVFARSGGKGCRSWPKEIVVSSFADMMARCPVLVVECAGHQAARDYVPDIIRAGVNVIVISTGSLADPEFAAELEGVSQPGRLIIPAGAILGIDGLSAATRGGLSRVVLTSTKPPAAWLAAASTADAGAAVSVIGRTVIFEGTARQAALRYPKNANVAATVALAGLGFDRTEVKLIADPRVSGNVHQIEATGTFGRFEVKIEGTPFALNPRTSYLTALSIVRAIELECQTMVI